MPIGTALVDRARVISDRSTGVKVEGRTISTPVVGEWFRARLSSADAGESPEIPRGPERPATRTSLMFGMTDITGATLEVRNTDRIEVLQPGTAFASTS